ncbi:unnamed protein product [Dracunculus medinensis]|uniref:RING-type E3 ubiquitin-protein ligase PPIL2 n=1 Tax=Dracunculus medinensis TaxID=318479 RepID=A0A0N4UI77_DRAME|nr:unnamed protein product [Dracunculus medinensis]
MGKKQHQKDKLYLTTTEWKEIYGGHKDDIAKRLQKATFKRLPFTHCSLSFLPFEDPVCSQDGIIFDLSYIIPYVKKFGVNPVSGKKMSTSELVHLKFDKDDEGNFRCPVTFRVFTPTSHIVAIRQTGNVYALEAVQELNIKRGFLKDLLTDEPFQKKDIISLQDPNNLEKFNMEAFHHVKLNLKTSAEIAAEKKAMENPKFFIRYMNNEMKETLDKLNREYVKKEENVEEFADEINAAHYSQGHVAAGLTSTTMEPITQNKAAVLGDDTVRYARVTKQGYVRIITNFGPINLELFCKLAPRACENFIIHCKNGYYNNTKFHRIIRNFMMQGGDPTGTGKGGESIWNKPFKDEIVHSLSHNQRGILSMANRGTDSNQSQFFITFRSCKYLDGKHTIFGKVVGGLDTLGSIERLETDAASDHPLMDVIFMAAEVFVDPFEEAEAVIKKEREELLAAKNKKEAATSKHLPQPKIYGDGVGKYLNLKELSNSIKRTLTSENRMISDKTQKKKKYVKSRLSDFSSW